MVGAGVTDTIPFGGSSSDSVILAEGYQMREGESVISPRRVAASPGYFEALGVRLARGRFFLDSDTADSLPVAIVDERLAGHFWPAQDPIGRRLYLPTDVDDLLAITEETVFVTVVGVIENMPLHDVTEGERSVGTYVFPMAQDTSGLLTFAVKTAGSADAVPADLRAAIAALDPELPLFDVQTMEDRLERARSNRRAPAVLSASFGGLALLLSAVGVYGVLAYLVAQRRKEIGIRLALGSPGRAIIDLVLREGLWLVGAGMLAGAAGAWALGGSLQSQLFAVEAGDPLVLGGVTSLLAAVAFAACALPARRATRIDPVAALADDR